MANELREKLVDAALAILETEGVSKLSQARVARAANIPQGHLTYYFPKRADLVAAVLERFATRAAGELQARLAAAPQAAFDLPWLLRQVAVVMRDRPRSRALLGFIVEAERDRELHALLLGRVRLVRALLASVLQRTVDDPDIDIALGTLWGIGLQHLLFEGHRSDEELDTILDRLNAWWARAPAPPSSGSKE